MTESSAWTALMMGLPGSGKSTYLGALFHGLRQGEVDGFEMEELPVERAYLIELETAWLALKPLERSRHHGPKQVSLALRDKPSGGMIQLDVPDVVGEDYFVAWETGGWTDALRSTVTQAQGILLFVRADNVHSPALIEVGTEIPPGTITPPAIQWTPDMAPTQAILCDLLEQARELRDGVIPAIAVLVTAWDQVAELKLPPSEWLTWQLPLLAQWLQSQDEISVAVFGISAQGGDVAQSEVRSDLAKNADTRPIPDGADPLTRPLRWLMTLK
jgi:hypothetical protein